MLTVYLKEDYFIYKILIGSSLPPKEVYNPFYRIENQPRLETKSESQNIIRNNIKYEKKQ
jgi:hypothetical protein